MLWQGVPVHWSGKRTVLKFITHVSDDVGRRSVYQNHCALIAHFLVINLSPHLFCPDLSGPSSLTSSDLLT